MNCNISSSWSDGKILWCVGVGCVCVYESLSLSLHACRQASLSFFLLHLLFSAASIVSLVTPTHLILLLLLFLLYTKLTSFPAASPHFFNAASIVSGETFPSDTTTTFFSSTLVSTEVIPIGGWVGGLGELDGWVGWVAWWVGGWVKRRTRGQAYAIWAGRASIPKPAAAASES